MSRMVQQSIRKTGQTNKGGWKERRGKERSREGLVSSKERNGRVATDGRAGDREQSDIQDDVHSSAETSANSIWTITETAGGRHGLT